MALEVVTCEGLSVETRVFLAPPQRVELPVGFTATFVARDSSGKLVYVIQEPTRGRKTSEHQGQPPEASRPRQFGFKQFELLVGDEGKPLGRVQIVRFEESRELFYALISYVMAGHPHELLIPVLMTEPPRDLCLGKSSVLERLL